MKLDFAKFATLVLKQFGTDDWSKGRLLGWQYKTKNKFWRTFSLVARSTSLVVKPTKGKLLPLLGGIFKAMPKKERETKPASYEYFQTCECFLQFDWGVAALGNISFQTKATPHLLPVLCIIVERLKRMFATIPGKTSHPGIVVVATLLWNRILTWTCS